MLQKKGAEREGEELFFVLVGSLSFVCFCTVGSEEALPPFTARHWCLRNFSIIISRLHGAQSVQWYERGLCMAVL